MTQSELFAQIWEEREHVSQVSGEPLVYPGHIYWYWQFSHILPKGRGLYNRFKLLPENIVLITWQEHQLWEFRPHKIKDLPEWKWVFDKREELKQKYHAK